MPAHTHNGGTCGYSGSESYREVERLLRESPELSIVTPYIGLGYMKLLASYSRKKPVRLITTHSPPNAPAIDYLEARPGIVFAKIGLFSVLLAAAAFVLRFQFYVAVFGLAAAALFVVSAMNAFGKVHPKVNVRFARNVFVHEKLYIGRDEAIVGSANLTYPGMHKNVEHIECITDPQGIAMLKSHFNGLWSSI